MFTSSVAAFRSLTPDSRPESPYRPLRRPKTSHPSLVLDEEPEVDEQLDDVTVSDLQQRQQVVGVITIFLLTLKFTVLSMMPYLFLANCYLNIISKRSSEFKTMKVGVFVFNPNESDVTVNVLSDDTAHE